MTTKNILVTTLGTTWAVVPELIGFTNPDALDLYAESDKAAGYAKTRKSYDIQPVDEVWTPNGRQPIWHG